jgi:hypothetical protein
MLKNETEEKTKVEITFNQHFLIKLIIITHLVLILAFLIAVFSGMTANASTYILGGTLLAIGIILWVAIKRKFQKDIQKYKLLITEIFGL